MFESQPISVINNELAQVHKRERHQYATVAGILTAAVAALGTTTENAQASYTPNPMQQAVINESLVVAQTAWGTARPDLMQNNACANTLSVDMAPNAELNVLAQQEGPILGVASVSPECKITLNPVIFTGYPAYPCTVIEHEYGHILGLGHNETNPKDVMYPHVDQLDVAEVSPGCAQLNTSIVLSDKQAVKGANYTRSLDTINCRSNVITATKGQKSYYCIVRTSGHHNIAEREYDRIDIKSNNLIAADGYADKSAFKLRMSTERTWNKNRRAGGLILKEQK